MKTIGQIFRQARKERGLSIRKFAELMGIDFTYVSKIENGKIEYPPGYELLSRVAAEFDQDYDMLLLASGRLPEWMMARILEKPEFFYGVCKLSDRELDQLTLMSKVPFEMKIGGAIS
jgi:HTH-type transcriptional regulator, competence development regulator